MDFNEMAKDPYNTDEETKILKALDGFERQAHAGALFEDLKRHPAWQKVEEYMTNQIEESQKTVFSDPDGDHRKVIFQIQGIVKLRNWINAQIMAGNLAAKGISEHFKAVEDEKRSLGIE